MEPFDVFLVVTSVLGIVLLECEFFMFKNRRVTARKWFFTPYHLYKPEFYNERGNQFRKILIALYIGGYIFVAGFLIFMSLNHNF